MLNEKQIHTMSAAIEALDQIESALRDALHDIATEYEGPASKLQQKLIDTKVRNDVMGPLAQSINGLKQYIGPLDQHTQILRRSLSYLENYIVLRDSVNELDKEEVPNGN